MFRTMGVLAGAAALAWASSVSAAEVKLPGTLVVTAYDVGSSGYSQMVGLGSILKNNYGTNVRVLPGKNDVSRLGPVKAKRAQFTATGSDSVYAQEAVFTFGSREWGPQPLRVHALALGNGAAVGMVTPGDKSIKEIGDIRGKRVAWIRGAPALNKAVESMMACAGVTWDDVEKVEFGGHGPAVDGFINNEVDALNNATFSALNKKIEASPRGIYYPVIPNDPECWKRINAIVPWYTPVFATVGTGIAEGGQWMPNAPYPVLVSLNTLDATTSYSVIKAMQDHFDTFKDSAPGAPGWALKNQKFHKLVPYHEGAIAYYKEMGVWPEGQDEIQAQALARQAVLKKAWDGYVADAPSDDDAFAKGWMKARAKALEDAGMAVIFYEW
ncbi:MAG: TAXI family TRAP transporter solute-binding subunit [Alphaproteobacteria bacterium]|nr:TAXI family TRAP transporter solute-binding subunit [Alphaproteobacteria bacterium]MCB9930201.1 TAXI family TRAP transporter solute-binding subunit [Alphaproteobacteria bacterium]